jgi:uncharacterized OB-fold protein
VTPAFPVPYVAAIVDLDEGWQMVSNVVECPLDGVDIGLPVEVRFVAHKDITVPCFRPVRPVSAEEQG